MFIENKANIFLTFPDLIQVMFVSGSEVTDCLHFIFSSFFLTIDCTQSTLHCLSNAPPAVIACRSGKQAQEPNKAITGLEAFLLIVLVVCRLTWKETLKWPPGTLPSFIPAFAPNSCDVCSSFHLFFFFLSSSLCAFPFSPRCLWWRLSVDGSGQQAAEAYRPPRAEGGFTFLSSIFFILFFLQLILCLCLPPAICSIHYLLKPTPNHEQIHNNFRV